MQEIAENVFVENGYYGGNVGAVITDAGLVCIDTPPLPSEARRWRSALAHLSTRPIAYVLNTSHLPHRILGNRWINAPSVAYTSSPALIKAHAEYFRPHFILPEDNPSLPELSSMRPTAPQLTFSEHLQLHLGGPAIEIIHTGGPTSTASIVFLPSQGIAFMGDTLVAYGHPFMIDADFEIWVDLLHDVAKKSSPYRLLIPGQGAPSDKPTEATQHTSSYIRGLRTSLRRMARYEKPVDDVLAYVHKVLEQYAVSPDTRGLVSHRLTTALPAIYKAMLGNPAPDDTATALDGIASSEEDR